MAVLAWQTSFLPPEPDAGRARAFTLADARRTTLTSVNTAASGAD